VHASIAQRAASTEAMLAIFSDEAVVRDALAFEAALAAVQAEVGLISGADAKAIATACVPPIDFDALGSAAAHAGTLAIPLVELLRERIGGSAAKALHKGATSQDVADTILMLQVKEAAALIRRDGARLRLAAARLAHDHKGTPMIGRTLLQAALPITFGLKAAGWMAGVGEALERFETETGTIRLQLGGPVGVLGGLDGKGAAVATGLAKRLGLPIDAAPWHSRRQGVAGLGASLAILTGAAGKIARDISLMAQSEVAEAFEPRADGRGGSSAMAHKRNPTGCQIALSAAVRTPHLAATLISALPAEHERGLGGWQAEAPVLADLFRLAHGAVAAMADVLEGLQVDTQRMAANLGAAGVGVDYGEAERLVEELIARFGKDA